MSEKSCYNCRWQTKRDPKAGWWPAECDECDCCSHWKPRPEVEYPTMEDRYSAEEPPEVEKP